MKTENSNSGRTKNLTEKEIEFNRGYFRGFVAAKKQSIEMVKDYFFANIRLMAREGKNVEEILCYLGGQR